MGGPLSQAREPARFLHPPRHLRTLGTPFPAPSTPLSYTITCASLPFLSGAQKPPAESFDQPNQVFFQAPCQREGELPGAGSFVNLREAGSERGFAPVLLLSPPRLLSSSRLLPPPLLPPLLRLPSSSSSSLSFPLLLPSSPLCGFCVGVSSAEEPELDFGIVSLWCLFAFSAKLTLLPPLLLSFLSSSSLSSSSQTSTNTPKSSTPWERDPTSRRPRPLASATRRTWERPTRSAGLRPPRPPPTPRLSSAPSACRLSW